MRQDPPESAVAAMVFLTAIAIGIVLFIEFVTKQLR